ncbi:MAG: hypothetical protein IT385_15870 [Deltaproteobacteria bacterium]|nr:hypothetical protein [Deltaproteobacteria bacterium]
MIARPPARHLLATLTALAVLVPVAPAAHAAIANFTLVGIEGVGELEDNLSDRLGTTVSAVEHFINLEDCERYGAGEMEITIRISPLPGVGYEYAAAYAPPGKTCSTSNSNPEAVDGQCYVARAQEDLDSTEITFHVAFDELIGSACDSGDEGQATVYIILQDPLGTTVTNEQIKFDVDLEIPEAPELTTVKGGDGRFEASWKDDVNDSDDTTYTLYWSDAPFTEAELGDVEKRSDISGKSIAIESGLDNGVTYYVAVVAEDEAENESPLSNLVEVVPQQTTDFWERYQQTGGTDPGGFCFIATAAYGSPLEGELGVLRSFRDDVLMTSAGGRSLVDAYYKHGRRWAAWIADKPALKALVRVALVPLVWVARVVLWAGPVGSFALLLVGVALLRHLRRRALAHPTFLFDARQARLDATAPEAAR